MQNEKSDSETIYRASIALGNLVSLLSSRFILLPLACSSSWKVTEAQSKLRFAIETIMVLVLICSCVLNPL